MKRSARVIALANQKGGTAKTTTTANLAAAIARAGHRVLAVDCDPQANLTTAMGLDYDQAEVTLAEVLDGEPLRLDALPLVHGVRLLPAHPNGLAGVARGLSAERGDQLRLREALAPVLGSLDFVLLDTPPTLSLLTVAALVAATDVLIPAPTEFLSLEGVGQLLETVDVIRKRFNPELRVMGILPVRYESRPRGSRTVLERFAGFGVRVFDTRIRKNVAVADAPGAGMPVVNYDPSATGSQDYMAAAQEVLRYAQA